MITEHLLIPQVSTLMDISQEKTFNIPEESNEIDTA